MLARYYKLVLTMWLTAVFYLGLSCPVKNLPGWAFLLRSDVLCKDLDLVKEHLICEITSENEMKRLMCSGYDTCELVPDPCPDGSYRITCLPIEGLSGLYYRCGCHVAQVEDATLNGTWTDWQQIGGNLYERRLYADTEFTCIAETSTSELFCKAKMRYMIACKVSRYCHLALHSSRIAMKPNKHVIIININAFMQLNTELIFLNHGDQRVYLKSP